MEYIIIVGGQLHNKGAQAMAYTVVDAMKKKFPEKEVVLFASVYTDRDEQERHILNFKVLPWTLRQKMNFLNVKDKFFAGAKENIKQIVKGTGISKETSEQIIDILKNATSMIDISGYALSSQRGEIASLNYLFNIIIAQKYKIPMFLMPQSFGPFEYDNKKRMINLIQDKLNYPTKIFAREQDGFNKLTDLGLKNAELTLDTVLQAKDEIQVSNIYKNKELLKLKVLKNSISIIPNDKIMEHGDKDKIFSIYKSLVSKALLEGKNIYLLRHSYEDLYICKQIKNEFKNEERVILIEEDLDCLEINDTLKQFDI
ncbi:hypothetical protein JCM19045_1661 [Bacillus sp. JCM 19045]|nr:hypothetical protein JCM19045_1661 [Bacillus sp. JCM 19045]